MMETKCNTGRVSRLLDRHTKVMGQHTPLFYQDPLELVSGSGVWLKDAAGASYLDLYNNVPCVGHSNPRVVANIAEQAATLNVHGRYLHEGVIEYVERLVSLHHGGIQSAILGCSGTEATEMALTLARSVTGKQGIICTDSTYHGNSSLVGRLTALPVGNDRGGVKSITTPQLFRPMAEGVSEAELLQLHLDQLEATIASFADSGGFAGIMLCSILANEGLAIPPSGWFAEATAMVSDAGGVVIADEVQSGFARSGSWWGYEVSGFTPDVVCMGKPMGNGFPLSAMATSHEMVTKFREQHRYFNTFASSPLQAAAGSAVIDEINDLNLVEQVTEVGASLTSALRALEADHPQMGDVRGKGLFIGIDWVKPGTRIPDPVGAQQMVERLKSRFVLVGKAGQHGNVLKIRPPLVFNNEHTSIFLNAFEDSLRDA